MDVQYNLCNYSERDIEFTSCKRQAFIGRLCFLLCLRYGKVERYCFAEEECIQDEQNKTVFQLLINRRCQQGQEGHFSS